MKIYKEKLKKIITIENQFDEKEILQTINSLNSSLKDIQRRSGDTSIDVKNFVIDWNNLEEVEKLHSKIQGRKQQLKKDKGLLNITSESDLFQSKWDAIKRIIDTDISFLYEPEKFINEKKFYVYVHCDTTKPIKLKKTRALEVYAASLGLSHMPFYVGKGTGDRYLKGDRNRYHTKVAEKKFNDFEAAIVKKDLTEMEALQLESKLIDIFGLVIYGGYVINIDEGINSKHRRFLFKNDLEIIRKIEGSL